MPDKRIDSILADHAAARAKSPAISFAGERLSYADLEAAVASMTGWLVRNGIAADDRIAVYARNPPESFITLFAASRIGAMMVPLNRRLSEEELAWQMQDASPVLLLYGSDFADPAIRLAQGASCPAMAIGNDLAKARKGYALDAMDGTGPTDNELMLVYASGTTGRPKGAVLAQDAMHANAAMSRHAYAMQANDVVLSILPLFHVGGLNIQPLPALLPGAHVVIQDGFDPAQVLRTIADCRVTQVTVVPTILGALLATDGWDSADLSSLRMLAIGSTDVPVALIEAAPPRHPGSAGLWRHRDVADRHLPDGGDRDSHRRLHRPRGMRLRHQNRRS